MKLLTAMLFIFFLSPGVTTHFQDRNLAAWNLAENPPAGVFRLSVS
jgi:hypothetical protein